jgi:uncharacterized protein (DUF488 family)
MIIHTIGFTQKSAEKFFSSLIAAGVRRVIDTRLHSTSQLSGFAKRDDLRFFLERLGPIDYRYEPLLAPTERILDSYKKKLMSWREYENAYLGLLRERNVETQMGRAVVSDSCLLCSEAKPHYCHRRLAAEYLKARWTGVEIHHIE